MACLLFRDMAANERALGSHSCIGSLFSSQPLPHYSGNFWAATSQHIKKLRYPAYKKDRMIFESWVCSAPGRYLNLYPNEVNRYHTFEDHLHLKEFKPQTILLRVN